MGSKSVLQGQNLLIEAGDAKELVVGEKITLMKWGNAIVTSIEEVSGVFTVKAELKVEDTDYKKTKKLTWITEDPNSNFEVTLVELDHLITKKKVEENEKVSDIVNYNSRIAYNAIAEGNMKDLKKGDIIQLERRGYFFVDSIPANGKNMTLNFIPDGKTKNMSKIESKLDQKQVAGGKVTEKQAAAAAEAKEKKAEADQGEQKLSKKDLSKLKSKEKKAAAKDAIKSGDGLDAKKDAKVD